MPDLTHRPRRLRRTEALRSLVRETRLAREDFILPLFACAGSKVRREIQSMPGVFNLSIDEIASEAYHEDGIVQQAIRSIKQSAPELVVMADTCLCEYTSHGHCGVVRDGEV